MQRKSRILGLEISGRVVAALIVAAVFAGCSGSQHAAVDSSRARDALKVTLDGWKKGDTPSSLKEGSPSIVAQDMDWLAGAKLVDYQVVGEGKEVESNLYVPVQLTMRNAKGKEVKKKVNYVVGTSPILTVFRDFK